ncbi:hypothetical protein EMN47_12010 [Prolixibacteraceae bacterium JC049]|nr:hypothetical protein [Prolixibacteraceae bacterium JC049]
MQTNVRYKTWESDDKRLIFVFKINLITDTSAEILFSLDYSDPLSSNRKTIIKESLLLIRKRVMINEAVDNYMIKGNLIVDTDNYKAKSILVVMGDLEYGKKNEQHTFKGTMAISGGTVSNSEKVALDKKEQPDTYEYEGESSNMKDRFQNVFPFISFISPVSNTDDFTEFRFVEYSLRMLSPPKNIFLTELICLNRKNSTKELQKLVRKYILDQYPGCKYFTNSTHLDVYTSKFIEFYDSMDDSNELEGIVNSCCNYCDLTIEELYLYLKSDFYVNQKEEIWNSYLASLIAGEGKLEVICFLSKAILACNLVEKLFLNLGKETEKIIIDVQKIKCLINAKIILPEELFPLNKELKSPPVGNREEVVCLIADLQMIKQSFSGYERSDIADIVSVMPHERRVLSRKNRNKTKESHFQKWESVLSIEEESRYDEAEVLKEVVDKLFHSRNTYNYNGLNTSYGPPTNVTYNGVYSVDKELISPSGNNAADFAKKLIEKVMQTINNKVKNSRKLIRENEYEELLKSAIDNDASTDILNGVYYWLNKRYNAQLINYGKRLILKLKLPTPVRYIEELEEITSIDDANIIYSPFERFNIESFEDITTDNYLKLCAYYDVVDFCLPPIPKKIVSTTLTRIGDQLLKIPEGYEASIARVVATQSNVDQQIIISDKSILITQSAEAQEIILNSETDSIAVALTCSSNSKLSEELLNVVKVNLQVECICNKRAMDTWKHGIFREISRAYQSKRNEYLTQNLTNEASSRMGNIIRNVLISYAVKMLLSLSYDNQSEQEKTFVESFLARAIEWHEVSYQWNNISEAKNENTLTSLLKAKSMDFYLPVHPKFSLSVLYFTQSGKMWNYGDKLVPLFKPYINLFDSLDQISKEIILEEWSYSVPTNLKILSNKEGDLLTHNKK